MKARVLSSSREREVSDAVGINDAVGVLFDLSSIGVGARREETWKYVCAAICARRRTPNTS